MADNLDSDSVIVDSIENVIGELLEVESAQFGGGVEVKPLWSSLNFFKRRLEFFPKLALQSLGNI